MCSTGLGIDRSAHSNDYHAIRPLKEVMNDIDKAQKMNARGFAFSGGEPTLRGDLPQLVSYAKSKGLSHIEVQSNGRMYFYKKYCRELVDSGVNNFVISFPSHLEKIHDKIMGAKGTHRQALQGIKNLNALGQSIKINLVIIKDNYRDLEKIIKFLSNFKIKEVRFTMAMIEGNAAHNPKAVIARMSAVAPHICRAIDIAKKHRIECLVYNMVPCLLSGHERYINDLGQMDTILIGPEFETSLDQTRRSKKIKTGVCRECRYDRMCFGVWKSYAEVFGLDELRPVKV
jgi:sulfatase maturation enzyme AslB (radical SAM superfamily)